MARQILRRGRLALLFEPRDFWVGGFWDSKKRVLYACPVPCLLVRWRFGPGPGALDIHAIRYSRTKGTNMTDQAQSPHDDSRNLARGENQDHERQFARGHGLALHLAWIKTANWPWHRRLLAGGLLALPGEKTPSSYLMRRTGRKSGR
jgi:hypothetical protein